MSRFVGADVGAGIGEAGGFDPFDLGAECAQ